MMSDNSTPPMVLLLLKLTLMVLAAGTVVVAQSTEPCELLHDDDDTRLKLQALLAEDSVRLVEYMVEVEGYSEDFWRSKGGDFWFQPWRWYRAKGTNSERLLLLFHYYYGILKPYLGIGTRKLDLHLTANLTRCLADLLPEELESLMRHFLYYDLKNETEREVAEFTEDIRVCSMRVGDYSGWGRLVYHCCSRDDNGDEKCADISDDAWVWVLRAFIIIVSTLLFLYFPKLIPKGYYVYSFRYYPPDGQSFNLLMTKNPDKYKNSKGSTVLPAYRWRKLRKLAGEVSKLQPDVVHEVKIKCMLFECGMDRLLSETSSPVSVFRSLFDALVRCKVRHADPLEDCCNAPVCGELCCTSCPAWHAWLRAVRTVLVLLLLALPALPILYVIAADNLEYQELAVIFEKRHLDQSYNFYLGAIFGKVVVGLLAGLYVLHLMLVVLDGCHDQNLARAYTELLQVTRRKARLRDRIAQSHSIIRKAFWPIKRFGVLAIPVGLILLVLLPVVLMLYLIVTSPVPKLLMHAFSVLCGKTTNRRKKTKAELSTWALLESVLFVVTLIDVFAVLTLALNFFVHVLIIGLVQLIVDITFVMKFLPILVLLLVYIRDAFKVVNNTYSSHHVTVLRHVLTVEAEDIKKEADKDWRDQENKIFKIVPSSAADPKGRAGKEQEEYKKKKLFFIKNDAVRMRTRSLVLFLDKGDIPYIPKKFLEHTTTMECPGSPGRLEEAYLRAAGRFGLTLVFLLFILLVVLAYADTYYISTTSQFFAVLFTGTIPLVMRYFFMNPGAVTKVDTCTLRFQTQMDDKVESFMQSWVVEDVEVDCFSLPYDNDHHDVKDGPDQPKPTPTEDAEETQPHAQPPPSPSARHPKKKKKTNKCPTLPVSEPVPQDANDRKVNRVNYMLPPLSLDIENSDDWVQYQNATDITTEPDQSMEPYQQQPVPSSAKREWKKKKSAPSPVPLLDSLAGKEKPEVNDQAILDGTRKEKPKANGKVSKKAKKEKMRIDLIFDISAENFEQMSEAENSMGLNKPPSIHWNRRSRLIKEGKGRSDYDV